MRLISIQDTSDDGLYDAVFKTSGLASFLVFIICLGIGIAIWIPFITDYLKGNVSLWWILGIGWVSFWCLLIAWFGWSRYKAGLLTSNWLVKLNSNIILIKFRSFQNHAYRQSDPVVIELSWKDIEWIRKTKETSHKDRGQDKTTEYFTYLDLRLSLPEKEINAIKEGLNNERQRKPLRSSLSELQHKLFKARKDKASQHEIDYIKDQIKQEKSIRSNKTSKSSAKYHDYPVRLLNDNLLRVRWNSISPNIKKALEVMGSYTSIDEEIKFVTDSSKELSGKALDDMILERLSQGDEFDAIRIVKANYGYNTTEAVNFLEELKK